MPALAIYRRAVEQVSFGVFFNVFCKYAHLRSEDLIPVVAPGAKIVQLL